MIHLVPDPLNNELRSTAELRILHVRAHQHAEMQ
jgi:hypothetical protein